MIHYAPHWRVTRNELLWRSPTLMTEEACLRFLSGIEERLAYLYEIILRVCILGGPRPFPLHVEFFLDFVTYVGKIRAAFI